LTERENRFAWFDFLRLVDERFFPLAGFADDLDAALDGFTLATGIGRGVVHDDAGLEGLIAADVGRQRKGFHGDIATLVDGDRHHIDANARLGHSSGFLQGIADVLVAIGHEHDAFGRVVGEHGHRALHCPGKIREVAIE